MKQTQMQIDAEQNLITVYWWNLGTRTIDHKGTYRDFLANRDIKISTVKHPLTKTIGFRAKIFVGSVIVTYDDFNYDYSKITNLQFEQAYTKFLDSAILTYLTYLGDKTTLDTPNKIYKINWR